MRSACFLVLTAALLIGCAKAPPTAAQLQADKTVRNVSLEESTRITEAQARAALSNKTSLSLSRGHGPQIEYASADGRVFLWYPGNTVVLSGEWEVRKANYSKRTMKVDGSVTEFAAPLALDCFRYHGNTYNPVTRTRGNRWECQASGVSKAGRVEIANGDIFGLSQRTEPPFVLTRDIESFAQVRARMGNASAAARTN